jgi:hypothetical protein
MISTTFLAEGATMSDTPAAEPIAQPNPAPSAASKAIAFLASPTGRRLLVFVLGFLTVSLNKRLGLELDAQSLATDVVLVLGYIGQSAFTDASKARSGALAAKP